MSLGSTIAAYWLEFVTAVRESPLFHGAVTAGVVLAIAAAVLGVIVFITFCLRRYFKRRPWIDRAHRSGVYLLTMLGVLVLLLGALLGAVLPVIPGILFLLLALLLLRKYYRSKWVEAKIRYLRIKLRFKRAIRRRLRKHRTPDTKKDLSIATTPRKKAR